MTAISFLKNDSGYFVFFFVCVSLFFFCFKQDRVSVYQL